MELRHLSRKLHNVCERELLRRLEVSSRFCFVEKSSEEIISYTISISIQMSHISLLCFIQIIGENAKGSFHTVIFNSIQQMTVFFL